MRIFQVVFQVIRISYFRFHWKIVVVVVRRPRNLKGVKILRDIDIWYTVIVVSTTDDISMIL